MKFDDLVESCGLVFRLAGLAEKCQQFISVRDGFTAQLHRLRFFCRQRKIARRLEQLFGRVPPALQFSLIENVAQQHFADLRHSRGTAHALQNVAHHRGRIALGELLDSR